MTSQTSSTEGPWLKLLRHWRLGQFTACRLGFFSLLTDLQSSEKELACLEIPEDFSFCFSCFDGDTIQGNTELPRFVRGSWMRVEPKVVLLTVVPQAPNEVKESQNLPLSGLLENEDCLQIPPAFGGGNQKPGRGEVQDGLWEPAPPVTALLGSSWNFHCPACFV